MRLFQGMVRCRRCAKFSALLLIAYVMAVRLLAKRLKPAQPPPSSNNDQHLVSQKSSTQGIYFEGLEKLHPDVRFRSEIALYFQTADLPKTCSHYDKAPPRSVTSQEVYSKCKVPRVPNIVHLVWVYGSDHEFTFSQLLSVLSMLRFIQPCCVLFWYENIPPSGDYWQHFLHNITSQGTRMKMFPVTVPDTIWGKKIAFEEHKSDILRFEILKHFGGIYMDLDVLILKPLTPLRCYDYTLGRENENLLPSDLVLSVPQAPFVLNVINHYHKYSKIWEYNSVRYPQTLANKHPEWIHIENHAINRPNWRPRELTPIFDASCSFNWHKNYAIHLWNRISSEFRTKREDPESIRMMSSTFGQIARYIYYGKAGECKVRGQGFFNSLKLLVSDLFR